MVYWLILFASLSANAPTTALHVGNFKSMQSCEAAAKRSIFVASGSNDVLNRTFACVQANETNTQPPPY
ncbi:MAG TPA: hypothetical protein VL492_02830 [Methylovirgula sp.]|jgi:hypothetical protein|nr:hypothetical protein [Methylovirgula sp.]